MLLEGQQYNQVTNNCRHFRDRLLEQLLNRRLSTRPLTIAERVGGGLVGVHAMLLLTVAKGLEGQHYWYVEPQTGMAYLESQIRDYLTSIMGINNPVIIVQ